MSDNQVTIERVEVLHGHTNQDTALLVKDYPYSFRLRCQIRYWVETATKGNAKGTQRFVSQTTNPKSAETHWNKPKARTYESFVVMYRDNQNHVQHWGTGSLGVTPAGDARMRLMGIYDQLTGDQRARYDVVLAFSRRCSGSQWMDWEETINALAKHIREAGTDPNVDGEFWVGPTKTYYLGPDVAAYIVTARQRAMEDSTDVRQAD